MTANPTPAPQTGVDLDSLYDMIVNGGPVMVPIGLCSVVALTYIVERSLRLRATSLGSRTFGAAVVAALAEGGAERAAEVCQRSASSMARVLLPGIRRWARPTLEREKAVEDAGAREVKRLSANLRPLVVVAAIAPLLGLLGTVWGMIEAFSNIALQDGLGKPEMLASGISQALITTAAGLSVAIPAQAAYFYYKARIDRFVRRAEDVYAEISDLELEQAAGGAA
jgi:biopolymer transport protein ExbB